MAEGDQQAGWDRRAAFVLVAAAVLLTALLQIIVFEQFATERLVTLAIIVVLFVVMTWVYAGGYGRATAAWSDWRLRRHVRSHPEMISALLGLMDQVEDVFGQRADRFGNAARSVLNEWWRIHSATLNTSTPSAFSEGDKQRYEAAQRATGFWSTHISDWTAARNTATHLLQTTARKDGLSFAFAAYLVRSYVASSIVYIQDFTNNAQQMGAARLAQIPLNDWATYSRRVNNLIDAARSIDRLGPSNTGYDLDLRFEPVVENLAMIAAPGSSVTATGSSAAPSA